MKETQNMALWALTPNGAALARRIAGKWPSADLYFSEGICEEPKNVHPFKSLIHEVERQFRAYSAHIFIMSTGIVVRSIAPLIRHKTKDPAVLVIDDKGVNVISILSGHLGGANALTLEIARWMDSNPVITTATDIHHLPAIDLLAKEKGLIIENPEAIKNVSMAVITGKPILLHDPHGFLTGNLHKIELLPFSKKVSLSRDTLSDEIRAGVFIDDKRVDLPDNILILRPPTLVAGIGCNRGTDPDEMKGLLMESLGRFSLSPLSLKALASIDLKSDEAGLLALAEDLGLPLRFFAREELNSVKTIKNPSAMVEKHVGVKSVCEAAAILGVNRGPLIIPKQFSRNVTVAVARISFTS